MKRRSFCLLAMLISTAAVLFAVQANAEPKAFSYLLPDSDTKVYTEEEIGTMDIQVTNYAKNEIYAKHGRKFRSQELQEYFNAQVWYSGTTEPSAFDERELSDIERQNVILLADREAALSWDGNGYELDVPGYDLTSINEYLMSDYNILSGLEVNASSGTLIMETDHFDLVLPNKPEWSYIQNDRDSFEIYYKPSRDAGYGGHIVTITAFDINDNTYEEFPSWSICGRTADKTFIAIFPTDVQFDPEDKTQSAEYRTLLDWAYMLKEENGNKNPFTPSASDEAVAETLKSYAE